MKKGISVFTIILFITFLGGCYYDKAELVYPTTGTACDTSAVRYSTDVVNILQSNCYTCHGGTASSGGGFKLDTYTGLRSMATNGRLVAAITHSPGASPMPKGGTKLSECNIAKIRTWVRNGSPNN